MGVKFSIGEYAEKSIHREIKRYLEIDESKHEIPICGYIADIVNENNIIEVQTKSFIRLKDKISTYLENGYNLTIVYPVSIKKSLNWLDPITMNIVETRRLPCRGGIYNIFDELYKIREWVRDSRITFMIITFECEEYRLLDGYGKDRKNRATKVDKVPTRILDKFIFNACKGYERFISDQLKDEFTSKQFSRACKCKLDTARKATLILRELNYIRLIGKKGREYLYIKGKEL